MSFDPSQILEYLQGAGPQSAAAVATFTSFLMDARAFFAERAQAQKSATIDDYLEWLRRQEHTELVDLIVTNREVFERSFNFLREGLLVEFDRLYAKVDQMHHDLTNLAVDPNRIEFKPSKSGWEPESIIAIRKALQSTVLRAKYILVNRNRTELTLSGVNGNLEKGSGLLPIKSRDERLKVSGDGASTELVLMTNRKVDYQQGDEVILSEIALEFDQCEQPLRYQLNEGRYVPISSS